MCTNKRASIVWFLAFKQAIKGTFLVFFILAFNTFPQSVNAVDDEDSNLRIADILDRLTSLKHNFDGQSIKASVQIKRISQLGRDGSVGDTNNFSTRECNLTMAFYPWGYVAQQAVVSSYNLAPGMALENWCIRSNNFSEDVDTYTNPSSHGLNLRGEDMNVDIYANFRPGFILGPLNPYDMYEVISGLDDPKISTLTNTDHQTFIAIDATANQTGSIEKNIHIVLDPEHNMFPIEGYIYVRGKLLTQWHGTYNNSEQSNYFPKRFWYVIYGKTSIVLSANYNDITVQDVSSTDVSLAQRGGITQGAVVNDYRFGQPFAYVEGPKSPTLDELSEMATNRAAIGRYQKSAYTIAPLSYTWPQTHGRWVVVTLLILWTIVCGIYFFFRRRREE